MFTVEHLSRLNTPVLYSPQIFNRSQVIPMSLTSHLQRASSSPIRQFFDAIIDDQTARALVTETNDQVAQAARQRGGPILVSGTIPTLAGTAYDFGFRDWVQPFRLDTPPRVARLGAQRASTVGWGNALPLLSDLIRFLPETNARSKAQCYVELAVFERFARALGSIVTGRQDVGNDLHTQLLADPPITLLDLLARMPDATVRDVAALLEDTQSRWPAMRNQRFVPNPNFPLSAQIGGADADWVIRDVLHECKVSYQQRPVAGAHLRQLLGYLLLDTDNALGLQAMGLLLPRQGALVEWTVPIFLSRLGIPATLPELRTRFAIVVAALPQPERIIEQVMITDPKTGQERRMLRIRVSRRPPDRPDPS